MTDIESEELEVENCYLVTNIFDKQMYVFADSFAECERRINLRFGGGSKGHLVKIQKMGEGLAPCCKQEVQSE